MKMRPINALLWGNSVAFSWMWGLGLFFSVQFTFQYGLAGLLSFAIPNALGLFAFGYCTGIIAKRHEGREGLALFFDKWSKPFRLIFYLYQLLAITLTVFAVLHYLFLPLFNSFELTALTKLGLFLPLTVLIVIAAGCLFGEEFRIGTIKWGHLIQALLAAAAVVILIFGLGVFDGSMQAELALPVEDRGMFFGYLIPVWIGFLVGPWLDLQQWQRAIEMRRESTSIGLSYFFGSVQFFLMLLFHGLLTLWVLQVGHPGFAASVGLDQIPDAHHVITEFMSQIIPEDAYWIPLAYSIFIGVCILTTLDSGYIALKWYLAHQLKTSNHAVFSIVPAGLVASPIPSFLFAGAFALVAVYVKLQLEYFMVFYASFFVGYAGLGIARCFVPNAQDPLPQIKMFSMASLSVVIFAYGFFLKEPDLMILGAIMPLGYVVWLVFNADLFRVVSERAEEVMDAASEIPAIKAITESKIGQFIAPGREAEAQAIGGHFEDKWFTHSFMATYSDTNSVGNVYFATYPLWVGKTRELFFNQVMPEFDLADTPFFILTRTFEHKFVRETQEFEKVTVRIRVSEYNRKMATLEHEIYNSARQILGKGKQQLIFVSSKDYKLLDIPQQVLAAFMKYL
ncbi:MAG: acyl-CoA thioesterase [Candidatus Methylacidiphilales bacterium]